ncbi:hypothetical protein CANTEDRAFT_136927 [Yamadazyma tenuis ATCC 10573]|uniref:VASt domain-containing protein n=1 Tax=Candida tenuis (strain ATCC 10573 / BCRC 21748 / CBS 615 / JCM 9827 / NBRC 10315 / NRRL Y-1498 / VKM Y-70) TaxID=590646 RepID=G3BE32_CANTC|nr:uncharacterized protein CANTEDRAFT_136927 [Yamadazyma tenuis ATCC 10573]EGV60445.1 hypothetical protein CANTEDRAFT_136927 [Yamadazyma tenuis ATCC 10573]
MKTSDPVDKDLRNRSNSSLTTRLRNRSRSNSLKPSYDESGRPILTELSLPVQTHTKNSIHKDTRPNSQQFLSVKVDWPHSPTDNTAESIIDQEIKPINSNRSKSPEDSGLFSSILNIAHNTANLITHKDKSRSTEMHSHVSPVQASGEETDNFSSFSKKLDALINDQEDSIEESKSINNMTVSVNVNGTDHSTTPGLASQLSPNSIHFASIRESPLSTLGNGNLSLNDFKNSKKDTLVNTVSRVSDKDKTKDRDFKGRRTSATVASDTESFSAIHDNEKLKRASKKRNKEFHQIFNKLPKSDRLIDDFSCALSRDILVQGRMYLRWVTNLLIPLQEVIQIEKRSTAVLFPNGMIIKTLHQKYTFATFLSRDTSFDLLTRVWHRVLLDKEEGKVINNDYTSSVESDVSDFSEGDDSEDDVDRSNLESDNDEVARRGSLSRKGSLSQNGNVTVEPSLGEDSEDDTISSGEHLESSTNYSEEEENAENDTPNESSGKTFKGLPLVGPSTHSPTSNEYVLKNQNNIDIQDDKITGLSKQGDARDYKYVKPLKGAIGPKQTTCLITDKILEYNLEKFILVEQATSTPDVPSGNAFKIRTRIYLNWGANNSTKIYVITNIEWTGKSWIKGPIEKGSIDGQKESMKILVDSVNSFIKNGGSGGKESPSKKRSRKKSLQAETKELNQESAPAPKNTTFSEKFTDLVEIVGSAVPIPGLPSLITGYIILFCTMFLFIQVYNKILMPKPLHIVENSILFNNEKFYLIPSVDNQLNNEAAIKNSEVNLWKWIYEKSGQKVDNVVQHQQDTIRAYKRQELQEIVSLAQMNIDELTNLLNE